MTDPEFPLASIRSSLRHPLTRRHFLVAVGLAAPSVVLARSASGSDDDKDDDHGYDDHSDDHGNDSDDHNDDHGGRGDDQVQPSGTVPAGSAEVIIDDDDADAYTPGTITIDLGQSVTWVNLDDKPHSATGADFDTGKIEPGGLATVMFGEPGVFPYSCQYHPVMTGIVEVRDQSGKVPGRAGASPEASPEATPRTGSAGTHEVEIEDFAFNPTDLEVSVGSRVRWTNRDSAPHTVSSTANDFDSGTLDQGDTFEHTFDEPGTYDYVCAFHPGMTGRITVTG